MGTWTKVLTDGDQVTKGSMHWYYYSASLGTLNARYAERWNDEWGISNSVNTQLSNTSDTSASHWQIVRVSRMVPYDATITRFQVNIEASGSNGDVEVELWKANSLTKNSNYNSGHNITVDHLATITYDYSANLANALVGTSRNWWNDTTSFNNTSLSAGDYVFVVARRTSGSDGTSYHIHSTLCYDISH